MGDTKQFLQCSKCKTVIMMDYETGEEAKYAGCPECKVTGILNFVGVIYGHSHASGPWS